MQRARHSIMTIQTIILASGSAIRQQLLTDAGLDITVIKAPINEEAQKNTLNRTLPFPQQALVLAKAKAASVAADHPQSLVIGADQICELEGTALSKPGNKANAINHLNRLQGKTHHQHVGCCIYRGSQCMWEHTDTASLAMRTLTQEEIKTYVEQDEPYSAAGGYYYESNGHKLFEQVEGERNTILGLPLAPLINAIQRLKK